MSELKRARIEELHTSNIIGKPMTPGYWVGNSMEIIPVTQIHMTCGGGMGGSSWKEYIKRIDNIYDFIQSSEDFIKVITYDGIEKVINKKYIVQFDNSYRIVKVKYNSQNSNYPLGIYTCYYRIKNDNDVQLGDEFGG